MLRVFWFAFSLHPAAIVLEHSLLRLVYSETRQTPD